VIERVLTRTKAGGPAPDKLRENAVRAHAEVADGLTARLRGSDDALDSLRERFAPSLTPRGFPRSRVFKDLIREASIAVVCGLAFACSARDRGLADSRLQDQPLLARALDPGIDSPSAHHAEPDAAPVLWRELRSMLLPFHGGPALRRGHATGRRRHEGPARRAAGIHPFSPLLYDLPPEIAVPDEVLARALHHLRGTLNRGTGNREADDSGASESWSEQPALDNRAVPIRSLGDIYEALVGGSVRAHESKGRGRTETSRRKVTGVYYTPEAIVRHIVSGTLGRLVGGGAQGPSPSAEPLTVREILNLKVLDPASGSGHFLLAAAEYLARACVTALIREGRIGDKARERSDAMGEYRKIIAGRCIYGVDIDPVAVELAGLSLWLYAADPGAPSHGAAKHLRCGNSLHHFDWGGQFPAAARGFDAVIGNPPYLSFSGRQRPGLSQWTKRLDARGKPGGWQTMHGLFMLKSLELAKRSGLVSMVVPDQVGHLKGYEPLRSRMLEAGRLLEVRYWGEEVFEGVTSPALTFIIRKTQGTSNDDVELPDTESPQVDEPREVRDEPARKTVLVDTDGNATGFSPLPGEEWFTSPSREVARRMSGIHIVITGFSDPGVHTGNAARKLVLRRPSGGSVPLLEGRQIHPFRCEEPERWLDLSYRPGKGEYFRVSPEETYRGTDIILRQTASRPVATRHVHRCHFRNSVLALRLSGECSVEYLLGILNSEAAAYLYRALSFESRQRSFPQVKVGLLRSLPVPDPLLRRNRSRAREMEDIVRRIEAAMAPDEIPAGHVSDPISGLVSGLEDLAWSLYGLPGDSRTDRSVHEPGALSDNS